MSIFWKTFFWEFQQDWCRFEPLDDFLDACSGGGPPPSAAGGLADVTHKSSNNRFHLFSSSKYVAVFDGLWIMLQEGQKNSTADLIIALHFQHSLSFDRRLLFALLAYLLYCPVSSHAFLDREIELFMVPVGKKAAIFGINLLPNILCSAYYHLAHISSNFQQ